MTMIWTSNKFVDEVYQLNVNLYEFVFMTLHHKKWQLLNNVALI